MVTGKLMWAVVISKDAPNNRLQLTANYGYKDFLPIRLGCSR